MIPEINLLPQYEKPSARPVIIVGFVFLIWALLLTYIIYQFILTNGEQDVLQSRLESLTVEKEVYTNMVQVDPTVPHATLNDTANLIQFLAVPTSNVMGEINTLIGTAGSLQTYSISGTQVNLQMQFNSIPAISSFLSRIESSPIFSHVTIGTIQANSNEESTLYLVQFTLNVNTNVLLGLTGGGQAE